MKKKKNRRRFPKAIITVIVLICIVLGAYFFGYPYAKRYLSAFSEIKAEEKLNLKTTELPDYVDVQLIDKGNARPGTKMKHINDIVIHYTGNPGTTAQNNRDYFAKPDTEVCSHFVIGLNGEIINCIPIDERSVASNKRNKDTISIEVCHMDESGKFNAKTYESLVMLTAWLLKNSDLTEKDVIRHYDITGKECPKYYVDNPGKWKKLKKDIGKELALRQ